MNRTGIKKLIWFVALRGFIGSIALEGFYFALYLVLGLWPRHQTNSGIAFQLGPASMTEMVSWAWFAFPRFLGASLLWSTLLVFVRSARPSLNFVIAVLIAMVAAVPSIVEIPNIVAATNSYYPGNLPLVLSYSLEEPARIFLAAATTCWAVDRLGLKSS